MYGECYDMMGGWMSAKCLNGRCYRGKMDAMACMTQENCDAAMPEGGSNGDQWCLHPWMGSTELYMYEKCPFNSAGDLCFFMVRASIWWDRWGFLDSSFFLFER